MKTAITTAILAFAAGYLAAESLSQYAAMQQQRALEIERLELRMDALNMRGEYQDMIARVAARQDTARYE